MDPILNFSTPPQNPAETGTPKSWKLIEARLGLPLPPDYKSLIDHYGTGSFSDFVYVYNPFAESEYLNLFYALDTLHQADQKTRQMGDPSWTAVQPFSLYPAEGGLLPWGCTANLGDTFFWHVEGDPVTWETIFYNLRSGEYEVWKYPLTEFLKRLFTRQIESVLLPQDFPSRKKPVAFIPVIG
jgi:hypothetical protein